MSGRGETDNPGPEAVGESRALTKSDGWFNAPRPHLTMDGNSYRLKPSSSGRRSTASDKNVEQNQDTRDAVDPETGEISAT